MGSATFRPRVTRLRVLRRGWGQFTAEIVTIADLDPEDTERAEREIDVTDIFDLEDEDAETGLPRGRERPN